MKLERKTSAASLVAPRTAQRRTPQHLRRFAIFWISVILLAFALLAGGSVYALQKLHGKAQHMGAAGQSLSTSHLFELAILSANRQHELWRLTGDELFRQQESAHLAQANSMLAELRRQTVGDEEKRLTATIARQFEEFHRTSLRADPDFRQVTRAGDDLLLSIRRYRTLSEASMRATMDSSERLDRLVSLLSLTLVATSSAILVLGSLVLWARIFRPMLELARAADAFGKGDLAARAHVVHDDEMGALARTFNDMASAIRDREKERLHFVATVAHDLRNPLVVIGGAAHLLQHKDDQFSPEQRREWLGNIQNNARKLESLISDLTDSVQAETGQIALQEEPLDLAALVTEWTGEQALACRSHPLHCEAATPCHIRGDRKRLERVVSNLISNAVKYSPHDSPIAVRVETRGQRGVLTVADRGVGIAPEDMHKLFLPFTRLERTQDMASGTGLGLSSVKKIVEAHGGTIHVNSQIDKGTTIEVHLPLLPEKKTT